MNVLIVGGGGREHALARTIRRSPLLTRLYAAPGNPGMEPDAECVPIAANDIEALLAFARKTKIDLTVVGPEAPLVQGIADRFQEAGLTVFGPRANAALLEGSKAFAKNLMRANNIPTAGFTVFNKAEAAVAHIRSRKDFPVVLKADGLAAGKGVLICPDRESAMQAVDTLMQTRSFGAAGQTVVVEDFIRGDELSLFILTDGEHYLLLPAAQDHKKIGEGDTGANTGGMGAYAPAPLATPRLLQRIRREVIEPLLAAMRREKRPYRGLLYAGFIINNDTPYVLEYNCRFGDPETQAVLPLVNSDLLPVFYEIARGRLTTTALDIRPLCALGVVLASGGYPGAYSTGHVISGLDQLPGHILCFHAGTRRENNRWQTHGGRVLNIVALADDFKHAAQKVYNAIDKIHFKDMYYRRDIGYKILGNPHE